VTQTEEALVQALCLVVVQVIAFMHRSRIDQRVAAKLRHPVSQKHCTPGDRPDDAVGDEAVR
jgi:hypothetical protein